MFGRLTHSHNREEKFRRRAESLPDDALMDALNAAREYLRDIVVLSAAGGWQFDSRIGLVSEARLWKDVLEGEMMDRNLTYRELPENTYVTHM